MGVRKSYRRVSVKDVCIETLVDRGILCGEAGTTVGSDIGKDEVVVVIRWGNGEFERPWSVKNPGGIELLLSLLKRVEEIVGNLRIGMESTGTYGEALRHALTLAKLDVQRVSGKAASDYAEIFDGVPSKHDGKDAALIAELVAIGKSVPWPFSERSAQEQEMDHLVLRMDAYRKQMTMWVGRLEGLLAKHWPEIREFLGLKSPTLLQTLAQYGSPAQLLGDPRASEQLASWSNGKLRESKIRKILDSAQHTRGVPVCHAAQEWIREVANQALSANRLVQKYERELHRLISDHEPIQRLQAIGVPTMCVLWSRVGDPRDYDSSGAYLKALGLNLKEQSSGKRIGQVAITKRGPSLARRWLYFAALRAVQRAEVRQWYEAKKSRDQQHGKMKGLIGVMRKLGRAIWHVSRTGEAFDWAMVFPGKPIAKTMEVCAA